MIQKSILPLVCVFLMISSCSSDRLDVDVSDVKVSVNFVNMDSIIMNSKTKSDFDGHSNRWKKSFGELYDYQQYCLSINPEKTPDVFGILQEFKSDEYIIKLSKVLRSKFNAKATTKNKALLIDGFKHLKYHLPNSKLPKNVVFMNTLFTTGVFCTEENVGIGMEWYIGGNHELVKQVPNSRITSWMKGRMKLEFLERDVVYGWLSTNIVDETKGNLAEHIIRSGKIMYLTEAAFPELEKNIILRYSKKHYDWALENEYSYWEFLVKEKMLYRVKELDIANMINDGPFTPGIPGDDVPDRLGQFLGWRIVKQYMDENENVSLEQLIKLPYKTLLLNYEIEE